MTKESIGFWPLLGLLFVGLRLGNVIDWSWLWVLAPFWGPLALLILLGAGALLYYVFLKK